MTNDPTNRQVASPRLITPDSPRLELAQRRSHGMTVTLFWTPETDAVAVSVVDVGGSFDLVLAPNERPLDVFDHPYAYAALRGLTPGPPREPTAPDSEPLCPGCAGGPELTCSLCRPEIRAEVASGFAEMSAYLASWAAFDAWDRARAPGSVHDRSRRDDQRRSQGRNECP
jgi:hypothetical protein